MKKFVIANWKLYVSASKCAAVFEQFLRYEEVHAWYASLHVIIAPPILALPELAARLKQARRSKILLAAQDTGIADDGAYTGSISPRDLAKMGVAYVIVGHSERRQYFNEDDALCRKKIVAAHAAHLKVIYCVGETKHERHEGRAQEIVREQLQGIKTPEIIAYEPRWAIGTGLSIEPNEARVMHEYIAHEMVREKSAVCYGGSVSPENAAHFVSIGNAAGVLVGSASTTVKTLGAIISKVDKLCRS